MNWRIKLAMVIGVMLGGQIPAYAERADRNKPIHLVADSVDIDDAQQTSTFTGNVLMRQGTLAIDGDEVVVVKDRQGVKLATAKGHPAGFRQKREGLDEYVEGSGERIEYNAAGNVMNIFGQAHVRRGHDDVRGEHIFYNARTEAFQVSGGSQQTKDKRVIVEIQPRTGDATETPAVEDPLSIKPDTRLPKEQQP